MKKDFFASRIGTFITPISIIIVVAAGFLLPENIANIVFTLFFFFYGGLCLWNYSTCKRVHCQITGFGFIGVGIIAVLKLLSIIDLTWDIIWGLFILVLIIGYGYEFIYHKQTGSCYKQ